jgi:GTP diphosphokinase / guanosine-3',5'-bis(diphosphate) 3'-diphosphatase
MKDLDELYERIGLGERLAPLVARRLLPSAQTEDGTGAPAPLAIAGTEGLLVTYARCCFPIPYDPIFAFLSTGRGVVIHRENCVNVEDYRKHPEKWLPVSWQASPEREFSSEIRVYVANRTGVLAAVAAAIASTETNIDHVSIDEQDSDASILTFELRVHDRKHLARIVRVIRRMPDVTRVTRTIAAHAHAHARNAHGEPLRGDTVRGEQEADEQDPTDENPE